MWNMIFAVSWWWWSCCKSTDSYGQSTLCLNKSCPSWMILDEFGCIGQYTRNHKQCLAGCLSHPTHLSPCLKMSDNSKIAFSTAARDRIQGPVGDTQPQISQDWSRVNTTDWIWTKTRLISNRTTNTKISRQKNHPNIRRGCEVVLFMMYTQPAAKAGKGSFFNVSHRAIRSRVFGTSKWLLQIPPLRKASHRGGNCGSKTSSTQPHRPPIRKQEFLSVGWKVASLLWTWGFTPTTPRDAFMPYKGWDLGGSKSPTWAKMATTAKLDPTPS